MLHYRGAHLLRPGLVGIVVMVCVILIGLQSQKFMAWGTTVRYQALFGEAAGLAVGDDVILFGSGDLGEPTAEEWADWAGTIGDEIVAARGTRRLPVIHLP